MGMIPLYFPIDFLSKIYDDAKTLGLNRDTYLTKRVEHGIEIAEKSSEADNDKLKVLSSGVRWDSKDGPLITYGNVSFTKREILNVSEAIFSKVEKLSEKIGISVDDTFTLVFALGRNDTHYDYAIQNIPPSSLKAWSEILTEKKKNDIPTHGAREL